MVTDAAGLEVNSLTVTASDYLAVRPILDRVSLEIAPGECLGLVGESGSGKSMTARSILGVPPDGLTVTGRVRHRGLDLDMADRGAMRQWRAAQVGVVFQEPHRIMDPTRTVGDYLGEVLTLVRDVPRREVQRRSIQGLHQVGIDDPAGSLKRYPHELSGGQLQRAVIAAALLVEPSLLIADEPTTALDTTTQALVTVLLNRARHERNLSMLYITHNLELAMAICDRIAVMYAGQILEVSRAGAIRREARHPYTEALLRCRPNIGQRREALPVIEGQPPGLQTPLPGCPFAPRCPRTDSTCQAKRPVLVSTGQGAAACFHPLLGKPSPVTA